MSRFIVTLSDEHRAKLEAYRARRGLRSEADAIRDLIERSGGAEPLPAPSEPKTPPSFSHGRSKTAVVMPKRERAAEPKFTSRLKGEWKAP